MTITYAHEHAKSDTALPNAHQLAELRRALEESRRERELHRSAVILLPWLELMPHTDGCVACRQRLESGR